MRNRLVIENFLGGLAPSRWVGNAEAGQYDPGNSAGSGDTVGSGWEPFANTDDIGLLRRGLAPGNITNVSLFQGKVSWMKTFNRNTGSFIYAYGQDDNLVKDRLYQINLATNTVTNASPWPHSLPGYAQGSGMEYYNSYLYYANGRYLGRYDLSLTFNDSFNVFLGTKALGATIQHPMIQGNGKLFVANSNFSLNTTSIATVSGDTVNLAALDLSKTEQVINALEFNKNFLYIATTNNTENNNSASDSFMYVWDTVSSSWQEQYKFPEENLLALKAVNGRVYAFGNRGLYLFTGGDFQLIQPYAGGPAPGGVAVHPNGIMYWGDGQGQTYAYGSPNPQLSPVAYKPYKNATAFNGAMQWATRTNLYVGGFTTADFVKRYGGSNDYVSAEWRTPMISLGRRIKLVSVYLSFLSWPSNCSVDVKWAGGDGSTTSALGTISTVGETSAKFTGNGMEDDEWQIVFTHTTGTGGATPKFHRIVIEWEPVEE